MSRQSVLADVESAFVGLPAEVEGTFELFIDFAWSAHSCLIEGYPQEFPDNCITLADACIAGQVSVEIQTEEPGMCFEEHIICDKLGLLTDEEKELQSYTCPSCGLTTGLASFNDPDDYECPECGEVGLMANGSVGIGQQLPQAIGGNPDGT